MSNNTIIRIKSIHNNVADAVSAANIDLSYNPRIAKQDIAELDAPKNPRFDAKPVTKAYVTENDEVYYLYECDIRLLNKFTPFSHCLSDSPFSIVDIDEEASTINISRPILKKCTETRKVASKARWILTAA
jgi:hypothetical protein